MYAMAKSRKELIAEEKGKIVDKLALRVTPFERNGNG